MFFFEYMKWNKTDDRLLYWMKNADFDNKLIAHKLNKTRKSVINRYVRIKNNPIPPLILNKENTFVDKLYNHMKINTFNQDKFCSLRKDDRRVAILRLIYIHKIPFELVKDIMFMESGGRFMIEDFLIEITEKGFYFGTIDIKIKDAEIGLSSYYPKYFTNSSNSFSLDERNSTLLIEKEKLSLFIKRRNQDGQYHPLYFFTKDVDLFPPPSSLSGDIVVYCGKKIFNTIKSVYENSKYGSIREGFNYNKTFLDYFDIDTIKIYEGLVSVTLNSKEKFKYFNKFHQIDYRQHKNTFKISDIENEKFRMILIKPRNRIINIIITLIADKKFYGIRDIKLLHRIQI